MDNEKKKKGITKAPEAITKAVLECIVMPNGEIMCSGDVIGYVSEYGKYITLTDRTDVKPEAK